MSGGEDISADDFGGGDGKKNFAILTQFGTP